ncbi:MAG: histidinol-phosphatase [Pirellulaceae bacterium]|nr:MAG: histidinol-phosphatase [Pirellulaceae bacterium]
MHKHNVGRLTGFTLQARSVKPSDAVYNVSMSCLSDAWLTEVARRREAAVQWAREAGRLTLQWFQRPDLDVVRKADASPVTEADRQAEQWLRDRIARQFPGDAVLGEEHGEEPGRSGFRWVLDPIDGTKSFIFGVPLYTTLVGIEFEQTSVVGVIHAPALDETVHAAVGAGCVYEHGTASRPARVSRRSLSDGLFVTSQVDSFDRRKARALFDQLAERAYVTRTWGDAYGYLLVATGRAELMIDPVMHLWDAAAILPVLEEAGGRFTDWQGRRSTSSGEGIGSNGLVHAEVLQLTEPFAKPAE